MKPDELLRMWLKDHAENRFGQAIACETSYRSGKFASVADRMAAVHRAAGDVYAAALRALDAPADQPAATVTPAQAYSEGYRDGWFGKQDQVPGYEKNPYRKAAATETALPPCPYGGTIVLDASGKQRCDHCNGPVHNETEEGCDHCEAGPWDPCDRGVDHSADTAPQRSPPNRDDDRDPEAAQKEGQPDTDGNARGPG